MIREARIRNRGLTLAEIPVALLVLGIVIVIAARTFSTAGHVQTDSRMANLATAVASAKLIELRSLPAAEISDGRDSVSRADGMRFARVWSVAQPIAGSPAKSVRIAVSWTAGGRSDSIEMATLIR